GLGATVKSVSERASSLVRLELELAALELKRKAASLGVGIGLAVTAAVLLVFGLGFATIAAGIATAVAWWLALLIVTVGIVLVAALLAFLGVRAIKKGTPPVPEQALAEAKLTTEALKGNGRH